MLVLLVRQWVAASRVELVLLVQVLVQHLRLQRGPTQMSSKLAMLLLSKDQIPAGPSFLFFVYFFGSNPAGAKFL